MHTLSIVIPAYNEEKRLPQTLESLGREFSADEACIIVVDDGSKDATADVARKHGATVIGMKRNTGKGAAVRAGMQIADGDYVVIYDADGATPPPEIRTLLARSEETKAAVVIGSRVLGRHDIVQMQWYRRIIGKIFHLLTAPLIPGIADASCGCKLFTRAAASKIFSSQRIDRFAFDIEILMLAKHFGFSIEEVPVQWTAVKGSKVRLLSDGVEMFLSVLGLYLRISFGRL